MTSLGVEVNADAARELPDAALSVIAGAINDMVREFPTLKGAVTRIDVNSRSSEYAHVTPFGRKNYLSVSNRFGDMKSLNADLAKEFKGGLGAAENAKEVIYHELGHVLVNQVAFNGSTKFKNPAKALVDRKIAGSIITKATFRNKDFMNQAKKVGMDTMLKGTTQYSRQNNDEFVGEAVGQYMKLGSKAPPASRAVVKQLKKMLG